MAGWGDDPVMAELQAAIADGWQPVSVRDERDSTGTSFDVVAVEKDGDLASFTDTVQHEMLGELESWNVQTIIVGPMPHQDRMIEVFRTLLGREPSYQGGVYVWWQVHS